MLLHWQGFLEFMQPHPDQIGPDKGQRQNRQEAFNPFRSGQMRRLKIKTSRLQCTEHGLDLPPLPVEGQGPRRLTIGDNDQEIIDSFGGFGQTQADDVEIMAIDLASSEQPTVLPNGQVLEALPSRWVRDPGADLGTPSDADDEVDLVFDEVAKPLLANEFPVAEQDLNLPGFKHFKQPCEQHRALSCRGIAFLAHPRCFGQHGPDNRNGDAFVGDGSHQQIDATFAQLPVRSVQCEHELILWQKREDDATQQALIDVKMGEETAQASVIRCGLDVWVDHQGKLGQVRCSELDDSDNQRRDAIDARPVPRDQGLQASDQSVNLPSAVHQRRETGWFEDSVCGFVTSKLHPKPESVSIFV